MAQDKCLYCGNLRRRCPFVRTEAIRSIAPLDFERGWERLSVAGILPGCFIISFADIIPLLYTLTWRHRARLFPDYQG